MRLTEEGLAFGGVVSELMAEDAKGARGVAETAGDVAGGLVVDEEGTELLRTDAAGGTGGTGRSFRWAGRLSDLQHWTAYYNSATETYNSQDVSKSM
jgi:hypothetical protein